MDYMRQTGRTTRMLERAIELAIAGNAVTVLVPYQDHVRGMQKQLHKLLEPMAGRPAKSLPIMGITIEVMPEEFDWELMRPANQRGAWPYRIWMVDHTVAEAEAKKIAGRIADLQQLQAHLLHLTY